MICCSCVSCFILMVSSPCLSLCFTSCFCFPCPNPRLCLSSLPIQKCNGGKTGGAVVNRKAVGSNPRPSTCVSSCAVCTRAQLLAPSPPLTTAAEGSAGWLPRQHFFTLFTPQLLVVDPLLSLPASLPPCLPPSLQREVLCQSCAISRAAGGARPSSARLGSARLGPPTLPPSSLGGDSVEYLRHLAATSIYTLHSVHFLPPCFPLSLSTRLDL